MTETYGYDKTPTPPIDYDRSLVPKPISDRSKWVRTKYTGEDVAEAYAQGMEIAGLIANEALEAQAYDGNSLADVTLAKDGLPTLDARIRRDVNNLENKKADKAEVTAQLAQAVKKTDTLSMSQLGQDVKEAMTGGSVAVVGVNAVGDINITNNAVTPYKTSFFDTNLEFSIDHFNYGRVLTSGAIYRGAEVEHIASDYFDIDGTKNYQMKTHPSNIVVDIHGYDNNNNLVKRFWGYGDNGLFNFDNSEVVKVVVASNESKSPPANKDVVQVMFLDRYKNTTLKNEYIGSFSGDNIEDDSISLEKVSFRDNIISNSNSLPLNRNKFSDNVIPVLVDDKSINTQRGVTFDGKVFTLTAEEESAFVTQAKSVDLSNVDYIDIYLSTYDIDNIESLSIGFFQGGSNSFVSHNLVNLLSEVKENGERMLRIPRDYFVINTGSPSWDKINYTRVNLFAKAGTNASVAVKKIEATKVSKGYVYMYFDDALKSIYDNALPIMEKYGLKGTLPVITSRPNVNPNYMTWQQIREAEQAGWLVVAHGHNSYSLETSSPAVIREELRRSQQELFDRGFEFGSKCFVAPQTSWSDEVDEIARDYYVLCRTYSYAGIRAGHRQEFPQSHPRAQYGYSPTVNDTAGTWINSIDQAINDKKEIAISWHGIDNSGGTYTNSLEMFDEVCAHIRQRIDEGVLECVTWQDTMLQSKNINPIDVEGNQYLVSDNGKPTVLTLPID